MGELLILRLGSRIPYSRSGPPSFPEARESIEIHRSSAIFDFSSREGPEAGLPGPASLIEAGILDEEAPRPDFFLEAGNYLIRQESEAPGFDLRSALRDYVRDAWWEGRKIGDRLILRRLSEDGQRAIQLITPLP